MLAYDKDKLNAWMYRTMAEDAADLGLISEREKIAILNRYPSPFFNPGTIVRIGLGLATMIAVITLFSLIQLSFGKIMNNSMSNFLYGIVIFFLLELMIRNKSHFRSGIDDLLLYLGVGFIMAGIVSVFDTAPDPSLVITAILTVLALIAAIRYADRLMSGLALIVFIFFIGFLLKKISQELLVYIPLVAILISLSSWFAASQMAVKPRWIYYRHCFEFIQLLSLVIAGACSNYYVISEVWYEGLMPTGISDFWKYFFIITTILIPLATITTGIIDKDKKRIRVGILMIAAAVMTYHYYLSSTPVEVLCIVYGSLLLLISYWLLKHYKAKEDGISFKERQDSKAIFEVESLLIGAGVGLITPDHAGNRYGGGSFGGAGSGGSY